MVASSAQQPPPTTTDSAADAVFNRFDIEFDAGVEPIFHGGELITGSLKVNLKQQITINAIWLQFKGRAVWTPDHHQHGKDKETELEKVYFDKDFVLLERPPGHPAPGHFPWNANFTYSLPFECPLPKGCPTSYESPRAFIRYFARCTLQTDDEKKFLVKKAFSVVAPPELRHLLPPPHNDEPVKRREVAAFGGCCCRSKMSAELMLPKRAYAPGEHVFGDLTLDNRHYFSETIEVRLVDRVRKAGGDEPSPPIVHVEHANDASADATATADEPSAAEATQQSNGKPAKTKLPNKEKKRRVVKINKNATMDASLRNGSVGGALTVAPSSSSSFGQHRVIFVRKLAEEDISKPDESGPARATLHLLTIPPVPSSIIAPENESSIPDQLLSSLTGSIADGGDARLGKLFESPSTATLKLRRQPFIRVEYAVQVSIGSRLLIEMPIDVHPIPIYANGIAFRPFGGGPQPIGEPDEASVIAYRGPFTFEPLYPAYLTSPKNTTVTQTTRIPDISLTELAPQSGGGGAASPPVQYITVTTTTSAPPDGSGDVTTTTTSIEEVTQLPDGSQLVHKRDETVMTTNVPVSVGAAGVVTSLHHSKPHERPPLPPPTAATTETAPAANELSNASALPQPSDQNPSSEVEQQNLSTASVRSLVVDSGPENGKPLTQLEEKPVRETSIVLETVKEPLVEQPLNAGTEPEVAPPASQDTVAEEPNLDRQALENLEPAAPPADVHQVFTTPEGGLVEVDRHEEDTMTNGHIGHLVHTTMTVTHTSTTDGDGGVEHTVTTASENGDFGALTDTNGDGGGADGTTTSTNIIDEIVYDDDSGVEVRVQKTIEKTISHNNDSSNHHNQLEDGGSGEEDRAQVADY